MRFGTQLDFASQNLIIKIRSANLSHAELTYTWKKYMFQIREKLSRIKTS